MAIPPPLILSSSDKDTQNETGQHHNSFFDANCFKATH
jgi:hypothetical protein